MTASALGAFGVATTSSIAAKIYIFEKTTATPITETVSRAFFGSDVHEETTILSNILFAVKADTTPDAVALAGDYHIGVNGTTYNSAVLNAAIDAAGIPSSTDRIFVTGNHDSSSLIGTGDFAKTGEAYKDDDMIIYAINEEDFPTTLTDINAYSTSIATVDKLDSYLDNLSDTDDDKAIFIICHVPLHFERGDNPGGYYMANMLKNDAVADGLDLVFVWGHNHTVNQNNIVITSGGICSFNNNGTATYLNSLGFTYINAGYVKLGYGLLSTVDSDSITLQRYTASGESGEATVVERKDVESIAITTPPDKISYTAGQSFNPTGMVVTAYFDDDSSEQVSNYTYSPTGALTTADAQITVSYGGKTTTQAISVADTELVVTGIAITTAPDKISYTAGQSFDPTGLVVTAYYDDGSNAEVSTYTYSPTGALTTATSQITVSYLTFTATQTISVTEASTSDSQVFFGTDMHQSTANLTNILKAVAQDTTPDAVALSGDFNNNGTAGTAYNSSVINSAITAAGLTLPDTDRAFVAGNNDNTSLIGTGYFRETGELYKDNNVIVYGINEYDFPITSNSSNSGSTAEKYALAQTTTDNLETYLNNLSDADKDKAIFILSHVPLHVKRGDNPQGYYMADMLRTVANSNNLDIVFVWGHNHTVDASNLVVTSGGICAFNNNGTTTTISGIGFTYINAGYITNGYGLLSTVDSDTITLQRYMSSGENGSAIRIIRDTTNPVPTCTITFDSQGGTTVAAISGITSGATITLPVTTKAGFEFGGWYTAVNGGGTKFTSSTPVTSSFTLFAKWTAVTVPTCTITFDSQGGTTVAAISGITSGATITLPVTTKAGFEFGGWYTEVNGGGTKFTSSTPVTSSFTLFAKWTVPTCTVTFDSQGGTTVAAISGITSGATITLPATTKSGFEFDGWYTAVNGGGTKFTSSTPVTSSFTLFAKWTATESTPSGGGGGGGGGSSDKSTKAAIILTDEAIPAGFITDHIAYLQGYSDNTIKPEGKVTREEAAAVFFRILDPAYRETIKASNSAFGDIGKGRWSAEYIGTLAKGKIINGYTDGTFRAQSNITRAELAAVVAKIASLGAIQSGGFSDTSNNWASIYINTVAEKGWMTGYVDGTFKPDQYVSRAEFVTVINNMLGRNASVEGILDTAKQFTDLSEDMWYYSDMIEASNSHHFSLTADGTEVWTDIYEDTSEK